MTTRQEIIDVARSLVGVRYRHGGRSRNSVDCCGVLVVMAIELGLPHEDAPEGYSRRPDGSLMAYLRSNMDEVEGPPEPADVQVFWLDRTTKEPQHVGITTEGGGLIHAVAHNRKVVEVSKDPYWEHRRVAVFRIRGIG